MIKHRLLPSFILAATVLLLSGSLNAFAAAPVGKVEEVQGIAKVSHAGAGDATALKVGDAIMANDTVSTEARSRVRITFADKTDLVVANEGKLVINEFVFDPAKPAASKARFSFVKSAFAYIGGLIDKGDVKLDADFGSIGIRGTEVYRAMRKNESWIYVKKGNVSVANKGGAVTLKDGQGTTLSAEDKAPATPHTWSSNEIDWIVGETSNPQGQHKDWK